MEVPTRVSIPALSAASLEQISLGHGVLFLLPTAQRSAHELPMVERQDVDSCLVYGGQQMILTGQNFTAESKVVFMEKTPGQSLPRFLLLL